MNINPASGQRLAQWPDQRTEILHNLPNQPTTFIGREEELAAALETLLRKDVQMVTFTGPGGTGKTRLSLEVANGLLGHFKNGVFFVPLGDITDPGLVVPRISQQLEVRAAGSQPLLQNLKDYLKDQNILLLLDNFEQLLPAASVVAELLAAAPSLTVLITSRIRLNLRGEHELPILPLPTPDFTDSPSIEQLAENESVKLFIERAQAAQSRFTLNENNASAVAQICQRLDGLPLAIELAAARIKMLPPQAILTRLTDRLKLLTGGAQDLPARQQTIRNTLDWSYGLLNAQEKTLYARLAVFVGGFMLEDAEAVCNLEDDLNFLEGITSLVNNSLLKQEELTGGEPRFRMLEMIREYALERLAEGGEMQDLRERHAQYFIGNILSQAMVGLISRDSTTWLDRLEREHDNIQAALEWNLDTPAGRELSLSVAGNPDMVLVSPRLFQRRACMDRSPSRRLCRSACSHSCRRPPNELEDGHVAGRSQECSGKSHRKSDDLAEIGRRAKDPHVSHGNRSYSDQCWKGPGSSRSSKRSSGTFPRERDVLFPCHHSRAPWECVAGTGQPRGGASMAGASLSHVPGNRRRLGTVICPEQSRRSSTSAGQL